MRNLFEALEPVFARPEMYVGAEDYERVIALVVGFDLASQGGALVGFREWLVVRNDGPANAAWPELVRDGASKASTPPPVCETGVSQREMIGELAELLRLFMLEREKRGVRSIFLDFQGWVARQDWYAPGGPDWHPVVPKA